MADNTDDLIISISTDQATLRRSIKRIEQDLGTLAGTVKKQFDGVGRAVDNSITSSMQNRINAMVGIGTGAAKEWTGALADQGKELERLRARYSPLFNTINNYKSAVADIRRAHALGAISSNEMSAAIAKERQAALAATAAIKGRNAALADTPAQRGAGGVGASGYTSNIAAQFQDIGVTAFGGMSPMTIALQQGTQLSAVFNDIRNTGQGLGAALVGAFSSILSPISLVTIGLVAGGAALIQYISSANDIKSADEILRGHAETIALLKDRYGDAADGLREYVNEGISGTAVDIRDRLKDARDAIKEAAGDRSTYSTFIDPLARGTDPQIVREYRNAFIELRASIRDGEPDLLRFREQMARIADNPDAPKKVRELAEEMREFDPEVVKVARSIPGMVEQLGLIEGTADRQAAAIGRLSKALVELSKIGVPALTDIEKVEEAYQRARSNASNRDERDDADRARRDALQRISDQNPTVINSDGNTTNVPLPGQKPVMLGDKPDAATKKQETAAQRAANAYRDLKKSADDRLAQMQQEIDLLGKYGIEADAARFSLDLFQQAEDKGRSLSAQQRQELEQKVELYRQYSAQLAQAKLQQDLLDQRRFNSMSAQDQQVVTTLRQYGLPDDLNSREAGQIRQQLKVGELADGIDSFLSNFSSALQQNGFDIGDAFGDSIKQASMEAMNDALKSLFKQLSYGLATALFPGNSGTAGSTAKQGGIAAVGASIGGAITGAAPVGAVSRAALPDIAATTDVASYIHDAALKRGIDPNVALAVAKSEGGLASWSTRAGYVKNGFREPSYGPFQLLKGGAGTGFPTGLGNDFMRRTGLDPSDPRNGPAGVDFALDHAAKSGWGAWYGADKAGISKWQGIGVGGAETATDAVNKLAESAGAATKGLDTFGGGLGEVGQALSTSAFPAAPAAPGGGGLSWLSNLFGPSLSTAQIAKYTPMVGLFSNGGDVTGPGSATSDSIPAMLSDGEFVVRASATKKHRALLHAINNGRLGHFADGGLVSQASVPSAPTLRPQRSAANDNGQPGVLIVRIDGANGDDHVRTLVQQGVNDGLGQYNKAQERGGIGTVQNQFSKRKG